MEKQRTKIKLNQFFILLLIIFSLMISFVVSFSNSFQTCADSEIQYSNVIVDLSKDENFDMSQYPAKEDDYSLQVIQVAESVNGELFIYVYQPTAEIKVLPATCINMANDRDSKEFYLFNLTLLNKNRTLLKYKVDNFEVKIDGFYRYYNIASIYRMFDKAIDEGTGNDNTIQEVSFEVGKLWRTCTLNDEVFYECTETETVLITEKYVDFLRYENGFKFSNQACDGHYVAFSTDKKIDKLLEAELHYLTRSMHQHQFGLINPEITITYGEFEAHQKILKYDETASNPGDGLFGKKYTWKRIETVEDFVKNEDLKEETKNNLLSKQWVLRFDETSFSHSGSALGSSAWEDFYSTEVSEVTILRLMFEVDGETYNLGVVDNKQSGDNMPGNKTGWPWWVWLIIGIVVLIILLPFLPTILSILFKLIVWVFKVIWWVITIPFKLLNKDK